MPDQERSQRDVVVTIWEVWPFPTTPGVLFRIIKCVPAVYSRLVNREAEPLDACQQQLSTVTDWSAYLMG